MKIRAFFLLLCYRIDSPSIGFCFSICFSIIIIMGLSIKLELNNRTKKDGTSTILIRVTQNRVMKRISTDLSVRLEHWNAEKSEVRRANPQYRQLNALLRYKMVEVETKYLDSIARNKVVSADMLVKQLRVGVLGDSFLDFADKRIEKMVSPNTRKSQLSVISKLKEYIGSKGLHFLEINYEFLINYERHLRKLGNGVNTIHANMKTIKAIYNEALNSGYFVPENGTPWRLYRPKKEKSKRGKLTEEQILQVAKLDIRAGINEWHSRNIFMLSFYLQGMRTADILQLTWGHIHEGRVEYNAGKTNKFRSKKIIDKAQAILDLYHYNGLRPTDYVFPFLKGKNRKQFTDEDWIKVLASSNALINGHLTNIAAKIGVTKISMHVARHSFADIAKRKTGNVYAVSNALDHSSVAVTEDYFSSATRAENDDLVDSVYGE